MGYHGQGIVPFVKRFAFLFCVFIWVAYSRGDPECSCQGGCDPNQSCDSNRNPCNKENVAYLKAANMSARYSDSDGMSGPACVAVNGRTSGTYQTLARDKPNCIHTAAAAYHWWTVDLGMNYTIAKVTIYKRVPNPRLKHIKIHVDEQLCYTFRTDPSGTLLTLRCDSPSRGRVVKLSKDRKEATGGEQFLNICEVQIWVCKAWFYGESCDKSCSGHCRNNDICDNFYGICHAGCADNFYGEKCDSTCGHCKNNDVCNSTTGKCSHGCVRGYQDPFCNDTCGNKTYGDDCSQKCGQCDGLSACDPFNGTCSNDCQKHFAPPFCKECTPGFYGAQCRKACGHCKDKVCSVSTGECTNGCQRGFSPPLCNTTCFSGTYGENCASDCGHCKGGNACDVFNGSCSACEEGYLLPFCLRKEEAQTSSPVPTIIGGSVAAVVVVLALLAVIGYLVYRRRQKQRQPDASKSSENLTMNLSDAAIAKPKRTIEKVEYINTLVSNSTEGSLQGSDAGGDEDEGQFLDESSDHVYGNMDGVYASFQATHPTLDAVQTYLVDRLASRQLQEEFKAIPKLIEGEPQDAAELDINMKKNRFRQVLPYDKTRVVLKDEYLKGTATDFINASYIRGYRSKRMYIAAQAPKKNTVRDFWRMIWQEQITHIVMLCNTFEDGKDKCIQYWPEIKSDGMIYGPVKVTISKVERRNNFYIRTLNVKAREGNKSRMVTQYHYVSWPDHGIPTTTSLVRFWHYVTSRSRDSTSPLLVHCSAGVGRTGSFIGLDIGKETAAHEGRISVLELVTRLRQERTLMVQAVEQYVFLHQALLEAYTARDTVISLQKLDTVFPHELSANTPNERIDNEFKSIMQMQTVTSNDRHDISTQEDNLKKNRSSDVLPSDEHIVYLTERVQGRNQYINAVFMPTFHDPRGSILTQLPLPSTLVDFWRLVVGNDITTIVSLCSPIEEKEVSSFCQYWPKEKDMPIETGPYTVSVHSKEHRPGLTSYVLNVNKKNDETTQRVHLQHFEGWEGEVECDTSDMIHLLELVFTSLQYSPVPRLLIQCRDGAGKSGLFSALGDIITRIVCDYEIDVYMTVRHLHSVVPKAVMSLAQYRYCYVVAQAKTRDVAIYVNA